MFGMGTGVSPSLEPPEKLETEKNKIWVVGRRAGGDKQNRGRAIESAGRRVV